MEWDGMSPADRRRWAVESVAMRVAGSDCSLSEMLVLAQRLIDFMNGRPDDESLRQAFDAPSPSEGELSQLQSEAA